MNLSANPKYHFLVVDDDPDLNTTFALMLEFHGHDVRTAHTGETALAMLEKDRFHLIITEYCLPRMQGDKLAAMIKQQWPDQPILMATANIEEIQKQIQPLAGVDGFLNKPFSMSQLREAILWVLDRRAGIRPGSLETPGAPDRHTEEPYHFLVVDDDPDLNTTFALMLEFDGHDVRTARTGETALAMLEKDTFDLIITEYCLPRMQGDKLAAMIKKQWPDQPILMATANIEEIQKQIQPLAGVDGFLNKPFSMSQLREAILWVLDRRAGIRQGGLETHGAPGRHTEEPY